MSSTRPGRVMGRTLLTVALLLVLSCGTLAVQAADPLTVTGDNIRIIDGVAFPLVYSPFTVKSDGSIIPTTAILYLTLDAQQCVVGDAIGGKICQLKDGQCTMTVTNADVGHPHSTYNIYPTLYWCTTSGRSPFQTFTLYSIRLVPSYALASTAPYTRLVNAATPDGTVVGLYNANCKTLLVGPVTMTKDVRSVTMLNSKLNTPTYLCAVVPGGDGVLRAYSQFAVSTRELTAKPSSGPRYTTVDFNLDDQTATSIALSYDTSCEMNQMAQQQSVSPLPNGDFAVDLTAPGGCYIVCLLVDSVFQPASVPISTDSKCTPLVVGDTKIQPFYVEEYAVYPLVMYAGYNTQMTFGKDAAPKYGTFEAGLFNSEDCTQGFSPYDEGTTLIWNVVTTGKYYACARKSGTTQWVPANPITVATIPVVNFPAPYVLGLGITGTITRKDVEGELTVGWGEPPTGSTVAKDSKCQFIQGLYGTTTGNSVEFLIPQIVGNADMYQCISTPAYDSSAPQEGYVYAVEEKKFVPYALTYKPLFNGAKDTASIKPSETITLDPKVRFDEGSYMCMAVGDCKSCKKENDANDLSYMPVSPSIKSITPIFPTAATYIMCVFESKYPQFPPHPVRDLEVSTYPVTVDPSVIIENLPGTVTISDLAKTAKVFLSDKTDCLTQVYPVPPTTITSDSQGKATFQSVKTDKKRLFVCGTYPQDENGVLTAHVSVGTITTEKPVVQPTVAVIGQTNVLHIKVTNVGLLQGGSAYVLDGSQATCTNTPSDTPVTMQSGTMNPHKNPYFTYDVPKETSPKVVTVCVGVDGQYVSAGDVKVVANLSKPLSPQKAVVQELPVSVNFGSQSDIVTMLKPNKYRVVDNGVPCYDLSGATVYASGSVINGLADPFLPPHEMAAKILDICLANTAYLSGETDLVGYFYGTSIDTEPYIVNMSYVQLGKTNDIDLNSGPLVTSPNFYLADCSTEAPSVDPDAPTEGCRTNVNNQILTSSSVPLDNPNVKAGQYCYVCQQQKASATGLTGPFVTGALTLVSVMPPVSLIPTGCPIRQYKPFTVTLEGWTIPKGDVLYGVVQPATTPCGKEPDPDNSDTFSMTGTTGEITITKIKPLTEVVFCIHPDSSQSSDNPAYTTAFEVLRQTVYYYPEPPYLKTGDGKNGNNIITTPAGSGKTMISSSDTCEVADMISTAQGTIQSYKTTLIMGCVSSSEAYYCESYDDGNTYNLRGKLPILHGDCTTSGGPDASIMPKEYDPAVAITDPGIDTSLLTDPFLSTSSTCSPAIDDSVLDNGYSPRYDETVKLYVCAYPVSVVPPCADGDIACEKYSCKGCATAGSTCPTSEPYTTTEPTLTIKNWDVAPKTALSRYASNVGVATVNTMTLNYQTKYTNTFFAVSDGCESSIGLAEGMSSKTKAAPYSTTGVRGLVYVCTLNSVGVDKVAIARFLSVSTPTVSETHPPEIEGAVTIVVGAAYGATLTVKGYNSMNPLYSMVSGADAGYEYAQEGLYVNNKNRNVFIATSADCLEKDNVYLKDPDNAYDPVSNPGILSTVDAISGELAPVIDTRNVKRGGTVYLCTGTPAGPGEYTTTNPDAKHQTNAGVAQVIKVATTNLWPTEFQTGGEWPITVGFVPKNKGCRLFPGKNNNCDKQADVYTGVPAFRVDEYGYGESKLVLNQNPDATNKSAAIGDYTVCCQGDGQTEGDPPVYDNPIGNIHVYPQYSYDVRPRVYVVGVPTDGFLLEDLTEDKLLPGTDDELSPGGFSTSPFCDAGTITTTYGSWTRISLTSISVTADAVKEKLYLCASVEGKSTPVAVPAPPAFISFVEDRVSIPDGGFDTCTPHVVSPCSALQAKDTVTIIHGSCCTDRNNIVGTVKMGNDNTCTVQLDGTKVEEWNEEDPTGTFTMCAYSSDDANYCVTLADDIPLTADCVAGSRNAGKGLSTGWLIFIILLAILAALLLAALLAYLIWACCCRDKKKEAEAERKLVALRQMEGSDLPLDSLDEYLEGVNRNPLLYYAAPGADEEQTSLSGYSDRLMIKGEEVGSATTADGISASETRDESSPNPREGLSAVMDEEQREAETIEREEEEEEESEEAINVVNVQRIEDDTRDQIALEEARARYMMCLAFKEELERQRLKEKEEEVELGYEEETPVGPKRTYGLSAREEDTNGSDGNSGDHQLEYSESSGEEDKEKLRGGEVGEAGSQRDASVIQGDEQSLTHSSAPAKPLETEERKDGQSALNSRELSEEITPVRGGRGDIHEVRHEGGHNWEVAYADEVEAPYGATAQGRQSPSPHRREDLLYGVSNRGSSSSHNSPSRNGAHMSLPMAGFESPDRLEEEDEEDYDELSYTTTQRFHDENRFLVEEEESRRQRLCNWEEEERAVLAQNELSEYMRLSQRPPSSDEDEEDSTSDMYKGPQRGVFGPRNV